MRTSILLLVFPLLLAGGAAAAAEVDSVSLCEQGDQDARVWEANCTAALEQATDPKGRSAFYTDRGFARINHALQSDHDFAPAIADLDEAIRLDPDDAAAYQNRANAYNYSGDFAHALADVEAALKREPDFAKAFSLRCQVLTSLGRPKDGAADCEHTLILGLTEYWVYENLGKAYEALGRKHEAILAYRVALGRNTASKPAREGLARLGESADD